MTLTPLRSSLLMDPPPHYAIYESFIRRELKIFYQRCNQIMVHQQVHATACVGLGFAISVPLLMHPFSQTCYQILATVDLLIDIHPPNGVLCPLISL